MIPIRLALAVAIAIAGVIVAARVVIAATASHSYGEAVPGLVLGGLLVAFGAYRVSLIYRVRGAQRR
jgi:hypothetical protein